MWYLYLDESGDLGFDFVSKKPSRYFTITILAISGDENNRKLIKAVRNTRRRKTSNVKELKGTRTDIKIKEYLYKQLSNLTFGLYSITLNKKRTYERLTREKERVYNYIARKVLDRIPFEKADTRVLLIVDKCKAKPEIA